MFLSIFSDLLGSGAWICQSGAWICLLGACICLLGAWTSPLGAWTSLLGAWTCLAACPGSEWCSIFPTWSIPADPAGEPGHGLASGVQAAVRGLSSRQELMTFHFCLETLEAGPTLD